MQKLTKLIAIILFLVTTATCFGQQDQVVEVIDVGRVSDACYSGVIVSKKLVLTIVGPFERVRVRPAGGEWMEAKLVLIHFANDWALLETESEIKEFKGIRIGETPPVGSVVKAYGYGTPDENGGRKLQQLVGMVSKDGISGDLPSYGIYGGPVFDSYGRLCGVVTSSSKTIKRWWDVRCDRLAAFCAKEKIPGAEVYSSPGK